MALAITEPQNRTLPELPFPVRKETEPLPFHRDIPESPRKTTSYLETHCFKKGWLVRHRNFDWWTIHQGPERSGKSTEAIWNCVYSDPSFLDDWQERIFYDGSTFFDAIQNKPKGSSLLFDEAGSEWLRAEWYEQVNINLGKALKVCGYKNLDVHIVTPNHRDLPKNVQRRANDWCVISLGRDYERGFLTVYGKSEYFFSKGDKPYLWERFYEKFYAVPSNFYPAYEKFKIEATDVLLEKYGSQIADASKPGMTFKEFAHEVVMTVETEGKKRGGYESFRNSRGVFDFNRVRMLVDCPEQVAKAAAAELTNRHPVLKGKGKQNRQPDTKD